MIQPAGVSRPPSSLFSRRKASYRSNLHTRRPIPGRRPNLGKGRGQARIGRRLFWPTLTALIVPLASVAVAAAPAGRLPPAHCAASAALSGPSPGSTPAPGSVPGRAFEAGEVGDDGNGRDQVWHHPVSAAVVDGFRPPSSPYGPGNRGLEYGTALGDEVRATAGGRVTFAGNVGVSRFVVISHPTGLRSTYAYLDRIETLVGAAVTRGQPIATAKAGFHLTARRGDTYIDPLSLMTDGCFIVRLVPVPAGVRIQPFREVAPAVGD